MTGFSSGEAAAALGIKRDRLIGAIMRCGAPDASLMFGGKRVFTLEDLRAIFRWYQARGKILNNPDRLEAAPAGA